MRDSKFYSFVASVLEKCELNEGSLTWRGISEALEIVWLEIDQRADVADREEAEINAQEAKQ